MTQTDPNTREDTERAPRILPLSPDELSPEALELATRLRSAFGHQTSEIPKVMATMLRHPVLYEAQVDYFVRRAGALIGDPRLREIALLRMSWLCQSGYLWGEHVAIGKTVGLTSEEIDRITRGAAEEGWTELEAALIAAVDEMRETATISDANWEILAANSSEQELIELLILIGDYQLASSLYNALRVELAEGNPGLSAR